MCIRILNKRFKYNLFAFLVLSCLAQKRMNLSNFKMWITGRTRNDEPNYLSPFSRSLITTTTCAVQDKRCWHVAGVDYKPLVGKWAHTLSPKEKRTTPQSIKPIISQGRTRQDPKVRGNSRQRWERWDQANVLRKGLGRVPATKETSLCWRNRAPLSKQVWQPSRTSLPLTSHKCCAPRMENPGEHVFTFRLGTRQHFGLFGLL